jgi:hypothetical protein
MRQLGLGEHAEKNARCPFHDDQRNSFSVFKGDSGTWFWKCHAGCGQGDEIKFLEKHKGISTSEAIKLYLEMARCAPVRTPNGERMAALAISNRVTDDFDWNPCVSALTDVHLERLGNERCYSRVFCQWLREKKLVGVYNGSIAFPNGIGTVAGVHIRQDDGSGRYHPTGTKTQPLILGDLSQAKQIHLFESQWDMLAFADRTGNYEAPGVAFVATRGACNAALLKERLPSGASILAWPQNDTAGKEWLNDLSAFVPALGVARVPFSIERRNEFGEAVEVRLKDMNDWTKAGAIAEDLYTAFWLNELFKPQPVESAALSKANSTDLAGLLEAICDYLKRFVVFASEAQPIAIALWTAHVWTIDAFDYTPYLQITSPEKQCGKSRVLDCLELIVPKPWRAISPSEAVLFRKIDIDKPTLLLDETDTLFSRGSDDRGELLRSLLNAGFERGAKVPRCLNRGSAIHDYEVFCPKAFAGIGSLPDTITDRCIPIRLRKKRRDESVERFRKRECKKIGEPIRERLEAWSRDEKVIAALRSARLDAPDALSDRQADICEPLLAIADLASGQWPQKARESLVELCTSDENEDSVGVKLLSDIRRVFDEQRADRLSTIQLVKGLVELDTENPWAIWWEKDTANNNTRGAATRLSQKLKRFGIRAHVIRVSDDSTPRGFLKADFEDAWARYCCDGNQQCFSAGCNPLK